jgi:hypothetical protein
MMANEDSIDLEVTEGVVHPFLQVTGPIQSPRRVAKKKAKSTAEPLSLFYITQIPRVQFYIRC